VCRVGSVKLAILLFLAGCGPKLPTELDVLPALRGLSYSGPDTQEVDLLRTMEGGNRIFVQAQLPDGEFGLFMVDTGADISVLSQETADRLELPIQENWGRVEGLSGTVSMDRAVIPAIAFGDVSIPDVEAAVGVPGIGERVGGMPLDGILGNNVWARFALELDYPADVMILHRPGTVKLSRKADLLLVDDLHILAMVEVFPETDHKTSDQILIQIDTGAGDLLLSGAAGAGFEQAYTEGLEPVYGIGATETLAPYRFQQVTRRIPIQRVRLGGAMVDAGFDARWINFDTQVPTGPTGLRGLAGHELLANHRVIFDFQRHYFELARSKRPKRQLNGHQVLLDQDMARFGDDDDTRALHRAHLHIGLGELEQAIDLLAPHVEANPDDAEARVLLARLYREAGNLAAAWDAIAPLPTGDLVDEDEIVAAVNGLLLDDRVQEAQALAAAAMDERPEEGWAYVALADTQLAIGDHEAARRSLMEAAKLEENPDAHLLRRARVAMATGDRYGSLAHIRKLVQLYPAGGPFLWFYAMAIHDDDADTFRSDLQHAMQRLHPTRKPTDFLVAAHTALGDQELALDLMTEGIERDCDPIRDEPNRDNCYAWYWSLANHEQEESLIRIERALEAEGDRSDFLDTKAMVHLSRGELVKAHEAAVAAARLSPQDVYMLWQAERIGALSDG
jgi:tetratricopeptide (TPR) repeat protein